MWDRIGKSFPTSGTQVSLESLCATLADPIRIHPTFLRGRNPRQLELCPVFKFSDIPVVFHLPKSTIVQVLLGVKPNDAARMFVVNGSSCFGMDREELRKTMPRWRVSRDLEKAVRLADLLSLPIIRKPHSIAADSLVGILRVAGLLTERGILENDRAKELFRMILPRCLDELKLSTKDVHAILFGLNRVRLDPSDAVVYPLMSNFAHWFLQRRRLNSSKRARRKLLEQRAEAAIPRLENSS